MKPDFFPFENVKGLWRTARHRAFYEELKEKMQHAGYVLTDRLMNALEYGAPQDRDRILLFGIQNKYWQIVKYQNFRGKNIKSTHWKKSKQCRGQVLIYLRKIVILSAQVEFQKNLQWSIGLKKIM